MDLGIDGKVALVMGASQGIGRAIAESLAAEGARVALASRSQEKLDAAGAEIEGETAAFAADTGDLNRLARLPAEVEEALGPIEILVTNTGGPPLGGALDHEIEHWEAAYRSLVLAPRQLAEAVVPGMRERGWGRIVNVGSSSTRAPIPGLNLSNAHRMAAMRCAFERLRPGIGSRVELEPTLTIRPQPRSRIPGTTASASWRGARTSDR